MSHVPPIFRARFRSMFEARLCYDLQQAGHSINAYYERESIAYTIPARVKTYLPDLMSRDGRLIIELKGRFASIDERMKYLHFIESNPDRELRFVLQRAGIPIYKGSKTTQEAWLEKHGFKVAIGTISADWIAELTK